jgi:catechol 2,3-dioxygenase-like lactoylglutathione lyase family enzyme
MFTHIMVGANDVEKSRKFYTATLGAIGYEAQAYGDHTFFSDGTTGFGVGRPANGEAACHANGGTIGFKAKTTTEVDAFHTAGLANGGTCEGLPGVRENAPGKSYGAYLRDPDGNKICAYAPNPNADQ